MKRIFSLLTVFGLITLVSCEENNGGNVSIEKDFDFGASAETAFIGEQVTFTDNSINVQSRTWTFEDGTPATSSEASVNVTFSSAGKKQVTLEVTYSDGTNDSGTLSVEVLNTMSADIVASGLTEMGCAKIGQEITFSLENILGEPTSYEWTFPGGTPATSTDASPKVTWSEQIDVVEVSCKLTRESDNATSTVTMNIAAGNYPLFKADNQNGLDAFGFEQGESNKLWYNWGKFPTETSAGEHPDIMTIVDGGANSSAKCMKIDISEEPGGENANIWEFAHRNNWSNNATMEIGKNYKLSMWFRTDADLTQGQIAGCMWLQLFSYVPDWLWDPVRELKASDSWAEVFPGETFTETPQTKLWEGAITTIAVVDGQVQIDGLLTNDWKQYSFDITLDTTLGAAGTEFKNCYIAFGLTGVNPVIYVDEVRLDLIEE